MGKPDWNNSPEKLRVAKGTNKKARATLLDITQGVSILDVSEQMADAFASGSEIINLCFEKRPTIKYLRVKSDTTYVESRGERPFTTQQIYYDLIKE